MHRFDYSEILGDIPQDIAKMLAEIAEIRSLECIRRAKYPKDYARMEDIAKLASVKYSNEIEGIVTSDERIREIVIRGGAPNNHSEEEIAGYRDALSLIHTETGSLGFNRDTILDLHSTLRTKGSDRHAYKDRDNAVIGIDPSGRRRIVFEPVPASETEDCMEQLCIAYQELSTQGYEPLLYIPCIILDYLCIHPFLDGNGRRWRENRWTYFPFIRYFLRTLLECFMDIDARFAIVDGEGVGRKQTVENVLMRSPAPMSLKQIHMVLRDVSIYTIQKVVKKLMSEGKIEKIGNTKGTRYIYKR